MNSVSPQTIELICFPGAPNLPIFVAQVRSGQHAGTITIEPFTSIAKAQGFGVLDTSSNVIPTYQGGSFATSRQWAADNPQTLKGFIKGSLAGLAWTLAPENRQA